MNYQRMTIEKEAPEEVGVIIHYNLSESAISDQTLDSLEVSIPPGLVLTYTEHQGGRNIRSLVADAAGSSLTPDDILITAGASTSLFIVATSLLGPRDHLIVTWPNYAANLETTRAIGCDITFIDLEFASQYRLDITRIAAAIRSGITRLISICSPNNPTGTMCTASELRALASLAKDKMCYLLVDETYADLTYNDYVSADGGDHHQQDQMIPAAASLGDHVIGVSSMSKTFGVPGIRIGWLSTTNKMLRNTFLAAKEQISISGSVLDEYVAEQILLRHEELLDKTIVEIRGRRDRVTAWVEAESELLEWVRPEAGVMCLVRMKQEPVGGIAAFYSRLLHQHSAYVGPGRWFEQDDIFFRLGFGWPTWKDLEMGLSAISKALRG